MGPSIAEGLQCLSWSRVPTSMRVGAVVSSVLFAVERFI